MLQNSGLGKLNPGDITNRRNASTKDVLNKVKRIARVIHQTYVSGRKI